MDPNLSYLLIAHYLQDRMVEAESARSVREIKGATAREPMPHRLLRRRFGRRSHDEVIVPRRRPVPWSRRPTDAGLVWHAKAASREADLGARRAGD